jgi:threonine dehydratase
MPVAFPHRMATMDQAPASVETPWHLLPPGFDEIEAAAGRIADALVRTPLLESERVNRLIGGRLLLKAEGLQRTGSFKARGAWNFISQMEDAARARGVIGFSSGNHAQAVAWAAGRHGAPAVLVMPADAPATKIRRTREWGAEVVLYDRRTEDREAIGRDIAASRGLTLIPPFEDRRIIAGAGTVGIEMIQQAEALGAAPDALLVNCSGGGLAAGCAIAAHALSPTTEVWAVEPQDYDDLARSLASGTRQANDISRPSICDALLAATPGAMTFAVAQRHLRGALGVSDAEAMAAMRLAFEEFRLVLEPGGAAALAAVLAGRIEAGGRVLAVLASGANVDAELFREALAGA